MAQDILTFIVNVFGLDDLPLEISSVTYQQKGDKTPQGTIKESEFGTEHVAYLTPAPVTLFITAPGYQDVKLKLDLSKKKVGIITEKVTLEALERIDVKIGGQKQALAAQSDTIVAYLATSSQTAIDRLTGLEPVQPGDQKSTDKPDDKGGDKTPRKAGFIVIAGEGKVGSAKRKKQLAKLRADKDVLVAGPIIGQTKEGPKILTEWANLTLDPWLNKEGVEELLKSLQLTFVELIPGSGNIYRACFKGEFGLDLLRRLDEIEQLKGIMAAEPSTYQPEALDAVPNDWALPYAWSRRFQVRADLAWDETRGALGIGPPDRTYGDPDVVVGIFDEGVLSVGGVPDNPEFQGTVSDTANTNTTAVLAAPRSVITVDTTVGIVVGNRISVGRGADQNKRVYAVNAGANQLTIDPLHFDHPGRTVVLDTATNVVRTRLAVGGALANTETLTVVSNAGFRVGQAISVGAEGAANTEQAVITALPAGGITVRGLNLTHPNPTQVQSGRKTYRFQDFATANFGPNNDNTVQMHGVACAGITLATADNAVGAAGMAPNVRLMGVQNQSGVPGGGSLAAFQWASGLINYNLHGPSPFTPGYLVHGIDIISSSLGYNDGVAIAANTNTAITSVTRGGRNRRGTLIFLSAGNGNTQMGAGRWSSHQNTFAVAASMVGQYPGIGANPPFTKEIRAFYSNYSIQPLGAVPNDLTFTAISGYTAIPGTSNLILRQPVQAHNPPSSHYIVSTSFTNRGNVPVSIANTANVTVAAPANNSFSGLTQSARQGDTNLQVFTIIGFAVGDWIRVGQWTDDPNNRVQWVQIVAPAPAPGVINCTPLGADHPVGAPNASTLTTRIGTATPLVTVGATAAAAGNIVTNIPWATVGQYITNGRSVVRIGGTSYRVTGSAAAGANTSLAVNPVVPAAGIGGGTGVTIAGNCSWAITNSTVVSVNSTAGFVANEWVMVGNPSNANCVMAHVHAVDPTGPNTLRISGPENAVTAAPATPIHRGPLHYQNRFNGTSAAAPHASGIGALILSAKPTLTWLEVRNIMQTTARKIDVGNIGFDLAPGGNNDGRSGPASFGRWYDATPNPIRTVAPGNPFFAVGAADATVGVSAQAATSIVVGAAANFTVGQAIQIGAGANADYSEVIARNLGTNTLTIEPLSQPWPGGTPVQGGRIPVFSGWYGPGRLDPVRALQTARAYSHDDRDLMIRNYLGDPGNVPTIPTVNPIISPDIFLRNANDIVGGPALNYAQAPPHQNPANGITAPVFAGGGANDLRVRGYFRGAAAAIYIVRVDGVGPDTVEWSIDGGATYTNPGTPIVANTDINLGNGVVVRFAAAAGHVLADTWTINVAPANHFIHARVANRGVGAGMSSLPGTYIRYYVALTDGTLLGNGNTPFHLPAGWNDSNLITAGGIATNTESAIYLVPNPLAVNPTNIGDNIPNNTPLTQAGAAVTINSGANMVFPCQWNSTDVPPANLNLKLFLLAEVLPHDGVQAGLSPDVNNNISYREIFMADAEFLNGAGTAALTQNFEVPNTGVIANLPFTANFKANWSNFVTENVELVLTTRDDSGTIVNVVYEHNGAIWTVVGGAPAWANFNPPVLTGTATPAAGNQVEITFNGNIDLTDTTNLFTPTLRYRGVHDAIIFEQKYEIVVFHEPVLLPNPGNGIAPAETPRLHEFAAMLSLTPQASAADAFGVDPGNAPATRFRITTRFVNAAPVRAYAVMTGQVFVQKADNDRVNLFLRPFEQSGMGFTPIKFYVYRGLKLTDFLAGPNNPQYKQVRARAGASDFIESCYRINDDINAALGTADNISPKAFGWDPDTQTDPNAYLDDFFFSPDPTHQLAVANKGMFLGEFVGNGALDSGFEVVLLDTRAVLDLSYARTTDHVITIPGGLPPIEEKARREAILGWVDPAAFYGLHYFAGVIQFGPNVRKKKDMYDDIMVPFQNKNRVYLDVRNETGYSMNYYGNYIGPNPTPDQLHSIKLRDPSQVNANSQVYGSNSWPLVWTDAAQPAGKKVNLWYLTLRRSDNVTPLLYAQHGAYVTPHVRDRFVEGANLIGTDPEWTLETGISFPNYDSTGTNVSSVLKFYYYRQLPSPPGNAVVIPTDEYTDNVFASIELLIRERPITGINTGTKTFTVAGNFTDGIDVGESVAVAGSTGGANDLTYTVTAVNFAGGNTNITVVEPIPSGVVSGRLQFNYSQWNTSQPTRWFSGTRKHYVDTVTNPLDIALNPLIGLGMVGESGIAVENARIILYVTPYHFFQQNLTRSINRINLKGGVGLEASFWTEIQNQNANLSLSASILVIGGGTQIPVFELDELDPTGGPDKPENIMAICLSDAEFSKIRQAMNENGLSTFHTKALNVTLVGGGMQTDNNGVNYRQYDVRIRGWDAAGNYTEINSSTVADPTPVVVYTLDSNRMLYTSEDFSNLENLIDIKDQPEENRRSNLDALAILAGDPAMDTLVGQFNSDLAALNNDKTAIENLVKTRSELLWTQGVNYHNSAPFDDRPLYWARLHFRAAIRLHPWLKKQRKLTRKLIKVVEDESRGFNQVDFTAANPVWTTQGVNFGTAKKILITGYDPFGLDSTIPGGVDAENPSGQVALHLHDKKITFGAFEAMVQAVIFPVRFKEFNQKIVEKFMKKYLDPSSPDRVDMIMTISQYGNSDRYFLERFAGRLRSAATDNNDVAVAQKSVGFGFSWDEFFQTTLPVGLIVPAGGGNWTTQIVYNQHYISSTGNEPTPDNGGANDNTNTVIFPTGKAVEGSGSNFLSNEIFYRVARLRERLSSTTKTGHLHIPAQPFAAGESRVDIVNVVKAALENSLPGI